MLRTFNLSLGVVIGLVAAFSTPARVAAQPAPPSLHSERATLTPPDVPEHDTVWSLSLGGTVNTGNTRSLALAAGTNLAIRRGPHLFTLDGQWTYGRSSVRTMGVFGPWQQNNDNLNGRVRYDFFFTDSDAVYGVVGARRDHFAGLDSRLQFQAGYARNFFAADKHRFWGEVGYDVTLDNFFPNPLVDPMTMQALANSDVFHSARIFVGYDNHVTDRFSILTGLEGLIDVEDIDNLRINWLSEFGLTIVEGLAAKLQYTMRFDNVPVSGTGKIDAITILNLTYTFHPADPPPPPAPPAPPAPPPEAAPVAPTADAAAADVAAPATEPAVETTPATSPAQ